MAEIKELEEKLKFTMNQLKECFEMSLKLKIENPQSKRRLLKYWEDFAKHFLNYVKRREKETGQDIIGQFSLGSFLKLLRL